MLVSGARGRGFKSHHFDQLKSACADFSIYNFEAHSDKEGVFMFFSKRFSMSVDNIFYIKNKGVVLSGIISKGSISVGDNIMVDNNVFEVIEIEVFRGNLKTASKGKEVGLIINSDNPSQFKHGLLITKVTDK